jgi:GNAT superfamily N-acetyltransferase
MEPFVRLATDEDLDAIYDICVRTADAGGDARGVYASDRLMGDLFAAPYVRLAPDHAFVLDSGAGAAVGYILGAPDTSDFAERYRAEWIPFVGLPRPADPPVTPDDVMLGLHHAPERMLVPLIARYPAHLHIDLLPPWQGRGHGRMLMSRFLDSLRDAGVPAVHLGMVTENTGARAFYDRLGFIELDVVDPLTYLGRSTRPLA